MQAQNGGTPPDAATPLTSSSGPHPAPILLAYAVVPHASEIDDFPTQAITSIIVMHA
jgi:hypothetical protein